MVQVHKEILIYMAIGTWTLRTVRYNQKVTLIPTLAFSQHMHSKPFCKVNFACHLGETVHRYINISCHSWLVKSPSVTSSDKTTSHKYDSQFHAIFKILNSHLKLKLFCTCSDMPQVGSLQKESSRDWPASTRTEVEVCITRERDNLSGCLRALTWTRSPRKEGQLWHLLNLWPW